MGVYLNYECVLTVIKLCCSALIVQFFFFIGLLREDKNNQISLSEIYVCRKMLYILSSMKRPATCHCSSHRHYSVVFLSRSLIKNFIRPWFSRVIKAQVNMYIEEDADTSLQICYIFWPSVEKAFREHSLWAAHLPMTVCQTQYSLIKSLINILKP